jgi:lysophospholipase L1-like esterase
MVVGCSKDGENVFLVPLGNPGVSKDVEMIIGLQSTGGTATAKGTFIDAIWTPDGRSFSLLSPSPVDRVTVYGDSITAGGNSDDPPHDAWPVLLRTTYGRDILVEAWGWRSLYDDASTAEKITNFVAHLLLSNPSRIYIAIGTNDFGLDKWSADDFGNALAALLDEIHSQDDSVSVDVQCPTYRTDEDEQNGFGDDLDDYRSAESSACSGRDWANYFDASTVLEAADLADGLHPTIAGHVKYALAVDTYLDSQ